MSEHLQLQLVSTLHLSEAHLPLPAWIPHLNLRVFATSPLQFLGHNIPLFIAIYTKKYRFPSTKKPTSSLYTKSVTLRSPRTWTRAGRVANPRAFFRSTKIYLTHLAVTRHRQTSSDVYRQMLAFIVEHSVSVSLKRKPLFSSLSVITHLPSLAMFLPPLWINAPCCVNIVHILILYYISSKENTCFLSKQEVI